MSKSLRSIYVGTVMNRLEETMRSSKGVGAGGLDPMKNHKNIGFLSNSGPNPLKNHIKQAFNVGQSSARQQNGI